MFRSLCLLIFVNLCFCSSEILLDSEYSRLEPIFDAGDPLNLQGIYTGSLHLVLTQNNACLGSENNQSAHFEASHDLSSPTSAISLAIYGRGAFQVEIFDPHEGWLSSNFAYSPDFVWRNLRWNFSKLMGSLRYRVSLQNSEDLFCKVRGPAIRSLDSGWKFEPWVNPINPTKGIWQGLLGVNLEANYIFTELDRDERRRLLRQAQSDGFNSIRLHKLTRLLQLLSFNSNFSATFQSFLEDLEDFNFKLSLDLLSWPLRTRLSSGTLVDDGWKQWIYISPELQSRASEVLNWFQNFKFYGVNFFESSHVVGICLFNENSLFLENPKNLEIQHVEPCETMLNVASRFRNLLINLGFEGFILMSNYQLSGSDQKCNVRFSSAIDRHLYFDYPKFHERNLKVGGRSPLEFLDNWRRHYQNLFEGAERVWISETNMPWPNQFIHELLPSLLVLNSIKPIDGIWFYDYRLRSTDFHEGGVFGIQRFRSVIEPLGWFKLMLSEKLEVTHRDFKLDIISNGGSVECTLRGHPTVRVPHCKWIRGHKTLITGPERALGDQFDSQFLRQTDYGVEPLGVRL